MLGDYSDPDAISTVNCGGNRVRYDTPVDPYQLGQHWGATADREQDVQRSNGTHRAEVPYAQGAREGAHLTTTRSGIERLGDSVECGFAI